MARTVFITGANRGIGLAILQAVALRFPEDHYLLGTRSLANGHEAVKQLRERRVQSKIDVLQLDVTDDESIGAAEKWVRENCGKLDVLVNNAGTAVAPNGDNSNLRASWDATFSTNVTSAACVTAAFLLLLRLAASATYRPMIILISSARASLHLSDNGGLPPTKVVAYSVSKTALNGLGIAIANAEPWVSVFSLSPGHCKTALNGFTVEKDPLEGAKVVVEVMECAYEGRISNGFWEFKDGDIKRVPW
ncbi:hypothetical protein MMC30_006800 [Trapelia coarctata]|nr:hypothetical protein [Trapelia coarctata]